MGLTEEMARFKEILALYEGSFRSAVVYSAILQNVIVQYCVVFLPHYEEPRTEPLVEEPRFDFWIRRTYLNYPEALKSLDEFSRTGVITLRGASKKFVFSQSELTSPTISAREGVRVKDVEDRQWSSWVLWTRGAKSLDKVVDCDFDRLYKALREEYGVSNLQELMKHLSGLSQFAIDSNMPPSIYVMAPVYARVVRCVLVNHKIRMLIEAPEGLGGTKKIYLSVLLHERRGLPSPKKIFLKDMHVAGKRSRALALYTSELDVAEGLRVELKLKDASGNTRSSGSFSLIWINQYKEIIGNLSRWTRRMRIMLSRVWGLKEPIVVLISILLMAYSAGYYLMNYLNNQLLPEPLACITAAMAVATLLMAYIAKKSVDISYLDRSKSLVQHTLDAYLIQLKEDIERLYGEVQQDQIAMILPDSLLPAPHMRSIIESEGASLPQRLPKLLGSIIEYNASVDERYSIRLRKECEEIIKIIDGIQSRLSKKYGVKPSPHGTFI